MNQKLKIRYAFFVGLLMALSSVVSNVILQENLDSNHFLKIIVAGLFEGIVSGVLFVWLMSKILNPGLMAKFTNINMDEDEQLIFETSANHFESMEDVGGKLYLTNKRLIFKSNNINTKNNELSIELPDIIEVDKYKTLGVINNGISVITASNNKEKFVVEKRRDWLSYFAKYAAV